MKSKATVVAITSGKGGVGKSIVAVNLAESLAAQGYQIALIDADFGQGACSVLLNENPQRSALDLARHTALAEQVYHRTTSGVTLIQGIPDVGYSRTREQQIFETLDEILDDLRTTFDFIIVDTPAGADSAVRWALDRAHMGILVLVGEPTAISDAYRLARLIWQSTPDYPLHAIVNFAESEEEARSIADRFGKVTGHFTGQETSYLGWVPFSAHIRRSVAAQEPAVRTPGPIQAAFLSMANALVEERLPLPVPIGLN